MDIFPPEINPRAFSRYVIRRRYKKIVDKGFLALAFLYGYQEGETQIAGVNLAVYRSELTDDPETPIQTSPYPMIHTLTLEKELPFGHFRELDRFRDGTICPVESVILGRMSELLLRQIASGQPLTQWSFVVFQPSIQDLREPGLSLLAPSFASYLQSEHQTSVLGLGHARCHNIGKTYETLRDGKLIGYLTIDIDGRIGYRNLEDNTKLFFNGSMRVDDNRQIPFP